MPFIDLNIGGGGFTPGDATVSFTAVCPASLVVGDVVYISGPAIGGLEQVDKIDVTTTTKMPAVGLVASKLTATTALILASGEASGIYTGMTPNFIQFAGTDAKLAEYADGNFPGPPSMGLVNIQPIAVALTSSKLFVRVQTPVRRVSG